MTYLEQAAREALREAVRKAHDEAHDLADNPEYGGDPLDAMVRRLAEYLLSDENIEKAARILDPMAWDEDRYWLEASRRDEARLWSIATARAALSAPLGKGS